MPYRWSKYTENNNEVRFINPYNFVPLGSKCNRADYAKGALTGFIKCAITPKTDLFIPNTSSDNAFNTHKVNEEHNSYDFYSYKDLEDVISDTPPEKPVIPGSELRGCIRSAFEALTDSCLSMDYDKELYTRTPKPKTPGILLWENNNWVLYKAQNIRLPQALAATFTTGAIVDYVNGERIFPSLAESVISSVASNYRENLTGIVLKGEDINGKKYEHIFQFQNTIISNAIDEKYITKLKELLELYRNSDSNQKLKEGTHGGYSDYTISKGGPIPVYYYKSNSGKFYFSPACISKNAYYNTLKQIVKNSTGNNESYLPCENKERLCPACNLFGTVTEVENGIAVTSRVRFSDAHFTGEKLKYKAQTTIRELAGPKFRCIEFYTNLNGSDPAYWNFPFYKD